MLATRKFNILLISSGKKVEKTVTYSGKKVSVKL